jgi:hypothetical protein
MPKIKEKLKQYNWNEKAAFYLNLARANKQPSYAELEENSIDSSFGNMISESSDNNRDVTLLTPTIGVSNTTTTTVAATSTSASSAANLNSPTLKMEFRIKVLESHISELNEKLIQRDEKIMMQENQIEYLKREIDELKTKSSTNNKNLDMCSKEKLLTIAACIFENFGSSISSSGDDEENGFGENGIFAEHVNSEQENNNGTTDDGCRYVKKIDALLSHLKIIQILFKKAKFYLRQNLR